MCPWASLLPEIGFQLAKLVKEVLTFQFLEERSMESLYAKLADIR